MPSVFEQYRSRNYPYQFRGVMHLYSIAGGVPLDPAVLERHISTKVSAPDDLIRAHVGTIMAEREITMDEAIEEAARFKGLVGFAKDAGGLYIPGANWKAGIVEAASVAASVGNIDARGWGKTNKGIKSFLAEHIFVKEDRLHLGADEPTEVPQSFIHKVLPGRGQVSAIQYTEVLRDVDVEFTIETDHDFTPEAWAAIFLTAEHTGFGAARKRGYGTGEMHVWERLRLTAQSNGGGDGFVVREDDLDSITSGS